MALDKPRLLFHAKVERRPFFRRFVWSLLGAAAAVGAWAALAVASDRQVLDNKQLLNIGLIIAPLVSALLLLRAFHSLFLGLRRKNEILRFFDQGFVWIRGKDEAKYSWKQLNTFREGVRQLTLFGRIWLQTGAQVLTMRDGRVFRVTGAHGDARRFAKAVRPVIADITGTRLGQALREQKSVTLHPQLTLHAQGITSGKVKIAWSALDIAVKKGKLVLYKLNANGQFKPAKSLDTHQINNLGGFIEIASSTIRNHQPERFNIKTQGPSRV